MTEAITPLRLKLLRLVSEKPGITRTVLLGLPGVQPADVDYLVKLDLIHEREVGTYRVSHLGQMALKRM